ncbi:hypothetical protein FQR65_LT20066 [Abscondita terminalis]|nr:hypothetical protein FQR65_LT20066 [Abscondita terminalis]
MLDQGRAQSPGNQRFEHRTYETDPCGTWNSSLPQAGVGLSWSERKEVYLHSAVVWQSMCPTSDTRSLVEIRHNLQLICERKRSRSENAADEGSAIQRPEHSLAINPGDCNEAKLARDMDVKRQFYAIMCLKPFERLRLMSISGAKHLSSIFKVPQRGKYASAKLERIFAKEWKLGFLAERTEVCVTHLGDCHEITLRDM